METAPTRFRYRDEALLLAASAPWFLNSLHSTPDLGQSSRDLLTAILPHIERVGADLDVLPFLVSTRRRQGHSESDSDSDDELGDSDDSITPENVPPRGDTVPAIIHGLVFLREIRYGPEYPSPRFRSNPKLSIKDTTFEFIFGKNRDDIEQAMYSNDMFQSANPDRVKNKARRTTAYLPADNEQQLFDLGPRGYELIAQPVDVVSDNEDRADDDSNGLPKDIDKELTRLWRQFLLDLTEKAPNMGSAGKPSYCVLDPAHRLQVNEATYQDKCLSNYFVRCQWKIGTEQEFRNAFNNLWPEKGKAKYNAQNYKNCRYYVEWGRFLDSVRDKETAANVRRALRKRFNRLFWIPHAQTDKIWWTKFDKTKPYLYHQTGNPQACPRVLVRGIPE